MTSINTTNPHTKYIEEYEDTDGTTQFEFNDDGWMPRYGYLITFQIEDHGGSSNGTQIKLNVWEDDTRDTTSNYYQVEWAGSGWQTNTRDRWNICNTNTGQPAWGQLFLGGGAYVNEPTNPYPVLHGVVGGSDTAFLSLYGVLKNAHSTIDGIRLWCGDNSTGFVTVEGWGPITER